jgi:HSP20 family protein
MAERKKTERSLATRQPREMEDWTQRWEDVFERPFLPSMRRFFGNMGGEWTPNIDVVEKENEYLIKAELPGVKEDDVEVSLTGDMLTISGEKEEEAEEEKKGYYYAESSYGSFSRSLTIPSNVDPDSIEANFNNGVLEVSLPKTAEAKPRKVRVAAKRGAKSKQQTSGKGESSNKTEMKQEQKEEKK